MQHYVASCVQKVSPSAFSAMWRGAECNRTAILLQPKARKASFRYGFSEYGVLAMAAATASGQTRA